MSWSRWAIGMCFALPLGIASACKGSRPTPPTMTPTHPIEIKHDLDAIKKKLGAGVPVVSARWYEMARGKADRVPGPTDTIVYALLTFDKTGWQELDKFSLRRTGTVELPADIAQQLLPPTVHTIASDSSGVVIQGQLYDASSFGNIWYDAGKALQLGDALFLSLSSR